MPAELIDAAFAVNVSTPEEVAAAVVFLASDDAANIHGALLSVDGGFAAVTAGPAARSQRSSADNEEGGEP